MGRTVTLFTGQWGDLSLEEICKIASEMGYEGLELATWGHINCHKAATDEAYVKEVKEVLEKYGLTCYALGAHLPGQCVGDLWDPRLDGFAPSHLAGKPDKIREWAIEELKDTARAAKALGCKVVTGFMGSAIWKYWYSFPQTTEAMIEAAYKEQVDLWTPIFDVFDECGIKFALEVHPTEIAFDYYTTERLFKAFNNRATLGINFDPSHLIWQGVNPTIFLQDFIDKVYHVHMKDTFVNLDGRNGILGSHLAFGDMRRGWNFVSLGHGDVDFDKIIRVLNEANYQGPLSVEWEDSGMDRIFGATEACAYVKKIDYKPSSIAFDDALKNE
ncbi:AP endonuclease [Sporanaerobium hydrogeniformans]|uniref:AP endonuclease n=1 Tax=Sporanaerobium hydrogeniformans TaxID=3072179 RepID=A0AC61D6W7_9FIRM|nr:sugar phosphate isomerase/epimerase [Sporanaerobium hydrogeniformans]PHV69345.1 AP endonuclease [Sporanaerobium hydrogeniformans]